MSKHMVVSEVEVKFTFPGQAEGEHEVAYPTLEIEYTYSPGSPGCMYERNGDPGYPGEPPEVELVSAKLVTDDCCLAPTQKQLNEWAADWLEGPGYEHACANADLNRQPDPDDAYERMRDDREDDARWDRGDDE